jgi:hypothetical protein
MTSVHARRWGAAALVMASCCVAGRGADDGAASASFTIDNTRRGAGCASDVFAVDNDFGVGLCTPTVGGGRVVAGVLQVDGGFDPHDGFELVDFATFTAALAGPGVLASPSGVAQADFARADRDGDGDVDVADLAGYQGEIQNRE